MSAYRRVCRPVVVGALTVGGDAPITIQSMLNTDPRDAAASVAQARALEEAGCEIIRATVPDLESAATLTALKNSVSCPIVADIHFDYRLTPAPRHFSTTARTRSSPPMLPGLMRILSAPASTEASASR